ncbi:MAG: hypothetical protein IAE67_05080 [Candidatus Competibacteraceae bacterium]|nr:hypothetical protein [Candidatus Competibacteraceae bacterium]
MKRAYVFVVCGDASHLDTLKVSYDILCHHTIYPIYIVTDPMRNDYPISYPLQIEISTPTHLNHHQASIWMKTSLHKILPPHTLFAYLDTDILAFGKQPDNIFDQYVAPIRFAPDHCQLMQFSSYAVNCECQPYYEEKRHQLQSYFKANDPYAQNPSSEIIAKRKQLIEAQEKIRKNFINRIFFLLKFLFFYPRFRVNNQFYYQKKDRTFYSNEGEPIMKSHSMNDAANACDLKWSVLKQDFVGKNKLNIFHPRCKHLKYAIEKEFNVAIQSNWQHWNGGVFLFSDDSHAFMNTWHTYTMDIFDNPYWKTRDQGTLIAAVWRHNLQHHPTLHPKWNLIIDYQSTGNMVLGNGAIYCRGKEYYPEFVHIYHHFGDTSWPVWNAIINHISK